MSNPNPKCLNCKWWQMDDYDEWGSEDEKRKFLPHEVRYCKHPKLLFYQYPESDGAAVFDNSQFKAYLVTGPDFGCVNFFSR